MLKDGASRKGKLSCSKVRLSSAVFYSFACGFQPQQTDQRKFLRADTAQRLTPLGRYLLDVGDSVGS